MTTIDTTGSIDVTLAAGVGREAATGGPGAFDADAQGYFGEAGSGFGGRFMPEALIAALDELEVAWHDAVADPAFAAELAAMMRDYAGAPSALYEASRLSELAGARILLKREDLLHTGAHKIRNVLGQALLTKRMGKKRVIAEIGRASCRERVSKQV